MSFKIPFVLMTAAWAYAEYVAYKNCKKADHNAEVVMFLCDKLDKAGVPITAFDDIIMNHFANNKP